jgi:raffinose/stachyose/melibiose transport system substrate-binding protein
MNRRWILALLCLLLVVPALAFGQAKTTLELLIHQNDPMVTYINSMNEKFQAKYPAITVNTSVVKADELATSTQTRLTANDVDVIDMFGFAQGILPFMKGVDKPNWQTLIEAGYLMDLGGQPFLKFYDASAVKDAGSFNGKVYEVSTGRYAFTGVFYNKDLFAKYNVKVPTTWSQLLAAAATFKKSGIAAMTCGGKDGWPVLVAGYGILLSFYPDQAALVKGLWTREVKWNNPKSVEMWKRMQILARDLIEPGASAIASDAAPGRFASGAAAMLPAGSWDAPAIEAANPSLKLGYFPMPASDNAADNKYLGGKYDVGWVVNAHTTKKDAALKWLDFFSQPANYQEYVTATGIMPTQPTATLNTTFGKEAKPYLANFRLGYELLWANIKGQGQWMQPNASFFKPFNQWDDPAKLADQVQADLEVALKAAK